MYGTDGVSVIDGLGDSVLTRISIPGQYPLAVAYDIGHDKVYCSVDSTVVVIDALTYRVTRTIPVGQYPGDMVWAPRHNRMLVANAKSSSISVIRDTSLAVSELRDAAIEPSLTTMVRANATLKLSTPSILLDVVGRRLGVLKEGTCRCRLPGPGVYYLVPVGGGASRKLVCVE
jgi:YVTN family beta-propeller protein